MTAIAEMWCAPRPPIADGSLSSRRRPPAVLAAVSCGSQHLNFMSRAEVILEMMAAGIDHSILDLDPMAPLPKHLDPDYNPDDSDEEESSSPTTRRGVRAIFDVFDKGGKGLLSTVTLGAAFHKVRGAWS